MQQYIMLLSESLGHMFQKRLLTCPVVHVYQQYNHTGGESYLRATTLSFNALFCSRLPDKDEPLHGAFTDSCRAVLCATYTL